MSGQGSATVFTGKEPYSRSYFGMIMCGNDLELILQDMTFFGNFIGGFGQTYYGNAVGSDGKSNSQTLGTPTLFFNHHSFRLENDVFALSNSNDRWRTNAWELTFGDFSIGSSIYTNWGDKASDGVVNEDEKSPIWGKNPHVKFGAWEKGKVYFAPLWVGVRTGNRVDRVGISHPVLQDLQQNGAHASFGKQHYYLDYNNFWSGIYIQSSYYNPFSLWGY